MASISTLMKVKESISTRSSMPLPVQVPKPKRHYTRQSKCAAKLTASEKRMKKIIEDRARRRLTIYIGTQKQRWTDLKERLALPSQEALAQLLLDTYETHEKCNGVKKIAVQYSRLACSPDENINPFLRKTVMKTRAEDRLDKDLPPLFCADTKVKTEPVSDSDTKDSLKTIMYSVKEEPQSDSDTDSMAMDEPPLFFEGKLECDGDREAKEEEGLTSELKVELACEPVSEEEQHCSANPHAGLAITHCLKEWRALPEVSKEQYRRKAAAQKNIFNVEKCINSAKKLVQQLSNKQRQAAIAKGLRTVALVYVKADQIHVCGYGAAKKLLTYYRNVDLIMSSLPVAEFPTNTCVTNLRKKLIEKMSAISDQQLGLKSFPYAKLQRGEYNVCGVPEDLLPLRRPALLQYKDVQRLLNLNTPIKIYRSNPSAENGSTSPDALSVDGSRPTSVIEPEPNHLAASCESALNLVPDSASMNIFHSGLFFNPQEQTDIAEIREKSCLANLRKKLVNRMSAVSDQQLGLKAFPYAKLQRGEYTVCGVPDDLLPLKPPALLPYKDVQRLLGLNINIFRSSPSVENDSTAADTLSVLQTNDESSTPAVVWSEPKCRNHITGNSKSGHC